MKLLKTSRVICSRKTNKKARILKQIRAFPNWISVYRACPGNGVSLTGTVTVPPSR